MRVGGEFLRHDLKQAFLHFKRVFTRRQPGPVRDAENMRVHGHGRLAKSDIENHIGRFAPDARERFQLLPRAGHLAAMMLKQIPAKPDDILRLVAKEPDGFEIGRASCRERV